MLRSRALWLGLFALAILAAEVSPVFADVPSPDGTYHPKPWGYGAPPPGWVEQNRVRNTPAPAPQPQPPQPQIPPPDFGDMTQPPAPIPDTVPIPQPMPRPGPQIDPLNEFPPKPPKKVEPQRTGPFRSCGSGAGTGLAGIALTWGMLWLGNRFVGRVSRSAKK
jgi:hypothetical protein